jgi:PEP-CTERM motif
MISTRSRGTLLGSHRRWLPALALGLAAVVLAAPARAASIQFAHFSQTTAGQLNFFTMDNATTTPGFSFSAVENVNFTFTVTGVSPAVHTAMLSVFGFTYTSSPTLLGSSASDTVLVQPMSQITQLSIIDTSDNSNLLSMNIPPGSGLGPDGKLVISTANGGNYSATTASGDKVAYTSDDLTFNPGVASLNLLISGFFTNSSGTTSVVPSIVAVTGSGGTFNADVTPEVALVPEPASLAMLGTGTLAIAGLSVVRRKRAAKLAAKA